MFSKLKQFKDLRNQAKQIKNSLSQESAEGSADWGKVKIKMNGNQEVISVEIDPELLSQDNKEKIESGIKEASNEASKKIQHIMAEKMKESGFNLPGM